MGDESQDKKSSDWQGFSHRLEQDSINSRILKLEDVVAKLSTDVKRAKKYEEPNMDILLGRLEDLETALNVQHTAIAEALIAMQQTLETVLHSGALPTTSSDDSLRIPANIAPLNNDRTPLPAKPLATSEQQATEKTDEQQNDNNTNNTQSNPSSSTPPNTESLPVAKPDTNPAITSLAAPKSVTFKDEQLPESPLTKRQVLDATNNNTSSTNTIKSSIKRDHGPPVRRKTPDKTAARLSPLSRNAVKTNNIKPASPRIQPSRKAGTAASLAVQAARKEMERAAAARAQQLREDEETSMCEYVCWGLVVILGIGALLLGVIAMSHSMNVVGEPGPEILTEL